MLYSITMHVSTLQKSSSQHNYHTRVNKWKIEQGSDGTNWQRQNTRSRIFTRFRRAPASNTSRESTFKISLNRGSHNSQEMLQREDVRDVEGCFLLHNVVDAADCDAFIRQAEAAGFSAASLNAPPGQTYNARVRNNERARWEMNTTTLGELTAKLAADIPSQIQDDDGVIWTLVGLDPAFRCYRYDVGQRFQKHYDSSVVKTVGEEQSFLTLIIYLNDDFQGGETTFFVGGWKAVRSGQAAEVTVRPRRGSALVFYHAGRRSPLHEGSELISGRKYALRTDVIYHRS